MRDMRLVWSPSRRRARDRRTYGRAVAPSRPRRPGIRGRSRLGARFSSPQHSRSEFAWPSADAKPRRAFWLAFNGEIYNYAELRRDLENRGETFQSNSDTEVLLRLLARRGPEALSLLNGMFALALVDTETRTFLLARDRLGVKPLYYNARNGELRFASELKALLACHAAAARRSTRPLWLNILG